MLRITKGLLTVFFLVFSATLFSQTTYTWNNSTGGSWATATNWTPSRSAAANTDILQFNNGGTYTITDVTGGAIGQLLVTGNTKVTLQSSSSASIQITGPTLTDNLVIGNGSRLSLNSSSGLNLSFVTTASQQASILGTLEINTNSVFTTSNLGSTRVTVGATGVINHFGGIITSSAATLIFGAGGTYDYKATSSQAVPTATWNATSNTIISGVTTGTPSNLGTQTFGNFLWNAASQSAEISPSSLPTDILGTFEVRNTNGQLLSVAGGGGNFTWTWTGDLLISGGRFALRTAGLGGIRTLSVRNFALNNSSNANAQFAITNISGTPGNGSATLTVNNDFNITLGQHSNFSRIVEFRGVSSFTEAINVAGDFTQTGNYSGRIGRAVSAGTQNFVFNGSGTNTYTAAKDTLFGTLTVIDVNAKTLDVGNSVLNYTGNFTLTGATAGIILGPNGAIANTGTFSANTAGQTLTLGSQQGITSTGSGATGNVQSTSTRTFNVGNHYIYNGTNGQTTGTALPASVTGSVTVILTNPGDSITFTATAAIGANGLLRLINGNLANAITYNATGRLEYAGTGNAQTTASNEFPASSGPRTLIINNAQGVVLHAARTIGTLTFTQGTLTTTAANVLTVGSASVAGTITGASASSYVKGPLQRFFTTIATSTTQNFPVGKSGYNPLDIITTSTSVTGSNTYLAEVFDNGPTAGTPGLNLGSLGIKYWRLTRESGTGTLAASSVRLTQNGIISSSRVGYSATVNGAYDNIGGSGPAASITSTAGNLTTGGYFTIGDVNVISAPTGTDTQFFCNTGTIADLLLSGTTITWYDAATAGNVLSSSTALVSGQKYYASNTVGIAESPSRKTVTAILTATPTATAPANQTLCAGQSSPTISLSGTPAGVLFDYSGGSAIGLANQTGAGGIVSFVPIAGSAAVTVTPKLNGCTGSSVTFNITVSASCGYTWTGTSSSNWATGGNWSPAAPTGGPNGCNVNVTIANGANQPTVPAGVINVGDLTIAQGVQVTLNGDLQVCGALAGGVSANAVVNGQGSLILKGSTAQNIDGKLDLNRLVINNTGAGVNAGAGAAISIQNALVLQQGNLNNSGTIVLKSDANTTGYLDNFSSGSAGNYNGNLTVERYIGNTNDGYRDLSAPVSTTVADWAADFSVFGQDAVHLWYAYNPYPNLQEYIENSNAVTGQYNGGFWSYTGSSRALTAGKGYAARLYAANNPLPLVIDATGTPNNGPVSIAVTNTASAVPAADGWNLVGNPYPSPVLWSDVKALNAGKTDGSYYVFNTTGEYSGNWAAHNGATGTNGAGNRIASSQGFFVLAQADANLEFDNTVRVAQDTAAFFKSDVQPNEIRLQLSRGNESDEVVAYTDAAATAGYDRGYDAVKIPAGSTVSLSYTVPGKDYAINVLNEINVQTILPLNIRVPDTATYTFSATELNIFPLTAYLKDAIRDTLYNLTTGNVPLALNGNEIYDSRFSIVFQQTPTGIDESTEQPVHIYTTGKDIIVEHSGTANATISVTNVLGQNMSEVKATGSRTVVPVSTQGTGYAFVKVTEGNKVSVGKVLIK